MLKVSYAGCPGLSPTISSTFTVEMCAAAKNCEKNSPRPFFLGGSRSFKVIDVDKSKKSVTSACYALSVPICNRFHATRDNCGKITTF